MTDKEKVAPPTPKQYERRRNQILLDYAPSIYACKKCGWPVIDGYCCHTCGDSNPRDPK